jgi:hypothetical protein
VRPVRILVGFGAGGGTDIVARVVADRLSSALGQQFVVENKPGAGGTVAGGLAAKAEADGYTALVIATGHAVSAVTIKQVPYDPVKSFEPVGILASSAYVVVVPKTSPATDLKGLVAHIKKGGDHNYATVTAGSTQHLIAEDIRARTGIPQYRRGHHGPAAGRCDLCRRAGPRRARAGGGRRAAPDRGLDAQALAVASRCADGSRERPWRLCVQRLVRDGISGRHTEGHHRQGASRA